jgi:homoserine dehydrogenase
LNAPLRIGIAGLGTVGGGVVRLLAAHRALLAQRTGREIAISAISARNRDKNRDLPLDGAAWFDDARD